MLCLVTIVLHSSDIACPWFAADVGRGLPNSLLAGRSLHSLDTKLSRIHTRVVLMIITL